MSLSALGGTLHLCNLKRKRMLAKPLRLHKEASYWTELSVEYALRDDDERDARYDSPRRGGNGRHGDNPYRRSPSPAYRRRPSPDYGRARSPVYDRYNGPAYDKHRSPDPSMGDIAADHRLEGPGHEWISDRWRKSCSKHGAFCILLLSTYQSFLFIRT